MASSRTQLGARWRHSSLHSLLVIILPALVLFCASAGTVRTGGAALANAPSLETPGPAFVDWDRGVSKQNDAARDARRTVEGGASPAEVFALLADDSGYVRDAVFEVLCEKWSAKQLLPLAEGLLHEEPLVAENLAEVFGRTRLEAAAPLLEKAVLRAPFAEARVLMLWALSEIDPEAAARTAATLWKKEKRDWLVRVEALTLLAAHGGEAGRAAITEALAEKKLLPERVAGLHALVSLDPPAAFEAALGQLEDPPKDKKKVWGPRIELAAIATLATVPVTSVDRARAVAAIDRLIADAEEATGRARTARLEALAALTGRPDTTTHFQWQAWWAVKRDSWEPGSSGGDDSPADDGSTTSVVTFHGIPVDSLRVTFLQDLSGGMSRNLQGENGGEGPTRLDHAKDELERVLDKLDDSTWVNVITFASTYFAPHEQPQLLGRARKSLVRFCREQEIPTRPGHARGNVYDALAFAVSSPYVDTVYLVSEGAPTEGKYHDYDRFLWHFERWNRWFGARVHVLLVAETGGRNRSFLESLAQGTGGTVRPVETERSSREAPTGKR